MSSFVLDASIALGWILDRPVPTQASRAQKSLLSGTRALVPALWHLEIANALAVAERRGVLSAADAALALLNLERLAAQVLDTETELVSMRQAWTTARGHQLSAYDSVYLELARRRNVPLATLDLALRNAAVRAGVALLH